MIKIKVGGVPEHFNYPWHFGIKNGVFSNHGIEVEWVDVKGGSGAMCKMLDDGELDVALVLTEGIVKHIHSGSQSRIIQQFVKSPLVWGVHSAKNRNFNADDLSTARFARSRYGSGSHLMAYVHAEQKGYALTDENFVTVKNIDGAIRSFEEDTSDILLWEKFMTQPYVNENLVDRIGLCVSPWPCFMMVGSGDFISKSSDKLTSLSTAIIEATKKVTKDEKTQNQIAKMYDLKLEQVELWYSAVEWQTSSWLSSKMLQNVTNTLKRVNLISAEALSPSELCVKTGDIY